MSNLSNSVALFNIAGFAAFYLLNSYEYTGFFLGVSANPSIIALTGLAIGFNCAGWIIRQSLHLEIQDIK
jgi:hypothetical protein